MREARLTTSAITVVSSRVDEVLLREDPFSIGRAYAVGKCKREQERFQGQTDFPEVRNPERNDDPTKNIENATPTNHAERLPRRADTIATAIEKAWSNGKMMRLK